MAPVGSLLSFTSLGFFIGWTAFFSARVHGQNITSACDPCTASLPTLYEYTWSPTSYRYITVTKNVTVATVVYLVDPAHETSTSTIFVTDLQTTVSSLPTTTNKATITITYGNIASNPQSSEVIVAYPTPFVDYGSEYTLWTGAIQTQSFCRTFPAGDAFTPTSHPTYSQPTAAALPNVTDSLGYDYVLVPNYATTALPSGYNQKAFESWYTEEFADEAVVAQCTIDNDWTPAPEKRMIFDTVKVYPSLIPRILSPRQYLNGTSNSTAFTHVSVRSLTDTSTSSVSTLFGRSKASSQAAATHVAGKHTFTTTNQHASNSDSSPAARKGQSSTVSPESALAGVATQLPSPTDSTSKVRPLSTSQTPKGSLSKQAEPTSSARSVGALICDGVGGCTAEGPTTTHESTTFTVAPESSLSTRSSSIVTTAESGQVFTHITTIAIVATRDSKTFESFLTSSFVTTAHGGESITLATHVIDTVVAGTRTVNVPGSTILTATSGQVFVLPTVVPSTVTSGSRSHVTSVTTSFTTTASHSGLITISSNRRSTITDTVGTHVVTVEGSTVITASSGQVLTLPTVIPSTVTSGSRTYITSVTSALTSTASDGGLITVSTERLSTITGDIGTRVVTETGSSVITASSGQHITVSTNILTTITSGSSTYTALISSSTVLTATSDGEVVTVQTESLSTMTLAAGTYTTQVPGVTSNATDGLPGGQFTGGGMRAADPLLLRNSVLPAMLVLSLSFALGA